MTKYTRCRKVAQRTSRSNCYQTMLAKGISLCRRIGDRLGIDVPILLLMIKYAASLICFNLRVFVVLLCTPQYGGGALFSRLDIPYCNAGLCRQI